VIAEAGIKMVADVRLGKLSDSPLFFICHSYLNTAIIYKTSLINEI